MLVQLIGFIERNKELLRGGARSADRHSAGQIGLRPVIDPGRRLSAKRTNWNLVVGVGRAVINLAGVVIGNRTWVEYLAVQETAWVLPLTHRTATWRSGGMCRVGDDAFDARAILSREVTSEEAGVPQRAAAAQTGGGLSVRL